MEVNPSFSFTPFFFCVVSDVLNDKNNKMACVIFSGNRATGIEICTSED
jgi:hypothetical protein